MVLSDGGRIWIIFACWFSGLVGKGRLGKMEGIGFGVEISCGIGLYRLWES